MNDMLRVVSDSGEIMRVRITEVDKKYAFDKKAFTRDRVGNIISIDDVVRCNSENSIYRFKKGIVKNICKTCIFLWDPKDFAQSNGIFVENPRNVTILGNEFLKGVESNNNGAIAC
jgi:transcription elongation factor